MRTHLISTAVALSCAGSAFGAFRGGAVLTNNAWNTAATTAIGEAVTVTRMYALFDEADDTLLLSNLWSDIPGGFWVYSCS